MHKRYIGKARPDASPDELRELFERRQQARAEAKHRRTGRGSTSSGGTSSSGKTSSGGTSSRGGSTSGGNASSGKTSGRASSDCFNSRRPPPLWEDFATIGSRLGVSFEEARRAYYAAISKEHPDRGGSVEQAKCINAAWERIKRHYGRR